MSYTTPEAIDWLDSHAIIDDMQRAVLLGGPGNPFFGPYFDQLAQHAPSLVERGSHLPIAVVRALGVASTLYYHAGVDYTQGSMWLGGDELTEHQRNVVDGKIVLLDPELGTTRDQAVSQVNRANSRLNPLDSRIGAALAALNYGAIFKPETMATPSETITSGQIDELLEEVSSERRAMPHLKLTNWAIGQTVASIYEGISRQHPDTRLRLFDIGSGTGSTIAAITNSIANLETVDRQPEFAMTAIEATPEFYELLSEFTQVDEARETIGLELISHTNGSSDSISNFGSVTTVEGDAVEMLVQELPTLDIPANELCFVTANYSWHRLSQFRKAQIMMEFQMVPNVVFIIGDLTDNTSDVNMRYFNLGVNGPLNTGNRHTVDEFGKFGFRVLDLRHQIPRGLDTRIIQRMIYEQENNDGHLWIAFRGPEAEEALSLQ